MKVNAENLTVVVPGSTVPSNIGLCIDKNGNPHWDNGSSIAAINKLAPSGGDDSAFMSAMSTAYGVVNLGPGKFKLNNPLLLEAKQQWRDNAPTYFGVKLIGAGSGATVIDCSGIDPALLKIHDTYKIIGITNASPAVVTLDPSTPLPSAVGTDLWPVGEARAIDGTKVVLQTPTSTQTTNTMEAINGITSNLVGDVYIKVVDATTIQLYSDTGLTVPLNTTDTTKFGVFGTANVTELGATWNTSIAWKMRRYYGNYNYTPAIRMVAPIASGTQRAHQLAPLIEGVAIRGVAGEILTSGFDGNGIAISNENNLTAGTGGVADTVTCQGFSMRDVKIGGFQAALNLDDSTNNSFELCNFQGCNSVLFGGYNLDITSFKQCRFGDDVFIPGMPKQQVLLRSPVYYAPGNTSLPSSAGMNSISFDSNWFMGCHDVFGDTTPTNATFINNYSEKTRVIGTRPGTSLLMQANHFSNFDFSKNLLNDECVFGTWSNQTWLANESDSWPTFGWTAVVHNQSNEASCSQLIWKGNTLLTAAPTNQNKGHIRYNVFDGSTVYRYMTIYDDVASGSDTRRGRGDYSFIGATQISGDSRVQHNAAATGNLDPIPEMYDTYDWTLTGAITIRNPCSASNVTSASGRSWKQQHNNGADKRCLKTKPLVFLLTQDATGGRAVTLGAEFSSVDLVTGGAATPGQKSRLEFYYNGSLWRLKFPNSWA